MSVIIRICIHHMKFAAYMTVWFITFLLIPLVLFIIVYRFCMLLFNIVNYVFLLLCYVFLLLCMFRSGYSVSLFSVYCLFVNVCCTTATGCQPN